MEFIYHDVLVLLLKISAQLGLGIERLSELENHIIVVIQTSRAQLSKIRIIDLSKGAQLTEALAVFEDIAPSSILLAPVVAPGGERCGLTAIECLVDCPSQAQREAISQWWNGG